MIQPALSSPLHGVPEVERLADDEVVTRLAVSADEPVLVGHYPGFPIVPGVCLLECAHRSVLLAAEAARVTLQLEAVESARFLAPVYPGDQVLTEVRLERGEHAWRCASRLATDRARAADVRLRYRVCAP